MHQNIASREEQAKKIHAIISDFMNDASLKDLKIIDVGCGSGDISTYFAKIASLVWGIEIDITNLLQSKESAERNLAFSKASGARLPFEASSFDLVLLPQVYEHTTQQQAVMNEIYRVLKPGGICFFSGPNRFQVIEPHFFLPFLSWLPHSLSDLYLRITKKGEKYDIYPRNYWRLRKMTRAFKRFDYTHQMLQNPEKFGVNKRVKLKFIRKIPILLIKLFEPLYPNYNWILVKETIK